MRFFIYLKHTPCSAVKKDSLPSLSWYRSRNLLHKSYVQKFPIFLRVSQLCATVPLRILLKCYVIPVKNVCIGSLKGGKKTIRWQEKQPGSTPCFSVLKNNQVPPPVFLSLKTSTTQKHSRKRGSTHSTPGCWLLAF